MKEKEIKEMELSTIPKLVQWHEGMLVSSHHFQQAFMRQEALLHYHLQNIAPNYWGIRKLSIKRNLLVSGYFHVEYIHAVMPDGLEIYFSGDKGSELKADLNLYKKEIKKKDLTIYLIVPSQKSVQSSGGGENRRYVSEKGELVIDENTGDNPQQIPRLKPALALLIADELSAKYVGFPLAKVAFKDANFILTDYLPPGLDIEALPGIKSIGLEIVQQLREKANFLSEKIKASSTATGLAMILETKDKIRSVVSALPQLETVLKSPDMHPFFLYQSLALLIGHLSSLDQGFIPPVLGRYDHNDLLNIFMTAREYIFRVTEQGIQEKYGYFSFKYDEAEFTFSIKIEQAWITDQMIIGVHGQPGMSNTEIEEWLNKCTIGSTSVLSSMRERRISGIKRKAIEGNEFLVPLRGVQLFTLQFDSEFMVADEELLIINPSSQVPGTNRADEIVLYIENRLIKS